MQDAQVEQRPQGLKMIQDPSCEFSSRALPTMPHHGQGGTLGHLGPGRHGQPSGQKLNLRPTSGTVDFLDMEKLYQQTKPCAGEGLNLFS